MNKEIKDILLNTLPFRYLTRPELELLITYTQMISFSDQERILQQGELGKGMYVILSGNALVDASTLGKDDVKLATLEEGNFFGEVSLIENSPCTASVYAIGPLECILITSSYFEMLGLFFPEITYKISKAITEETCERIKLLHKNIIEIIQTTEISGPSLFKKLAKTLVNPEVLSLEKSSIDFKNIKETDFFKIFSDEEYQELLNTNPILNVPKNCQLIYGGEKESSFFIVLRGAIAATIEDNNKIAKLGVLSPVHIFGTIYYILGEPAVINYGSADRAIVLQITMSKLMEYQKTRILMWYKLFGQICKFFISLERVADKLYLRLNAESFK